MAQHVFSLIIWTNQIKKSQVAEYICRIIWLKLITIVWIWSEHQWDRIEFYVYNDFGSNQIINNKSRKKLEKIFHVIIIEKSKIYHINKWWRSDVLRSSFCILKQTNRKKLQRAQRKTNVLLIVWFNKNLMLFAYSRKGKDVVIIYPSIISF